MKAVERDDKTSIVDRQATRLPDKPWGSRLLRGLIGLGIASILFYFAWWGSVDRLSSPWHLLIVILVVIYLTPQFLGTWLLYLLACRRIAPQSPPDGLSVDVFVTVCGEHYELVERSLTAACGMRGAHRTWLLDDGADPALACLATQLGAGYLTRTERTHAKAGNVNAALLQTRGDIVAIFDVDHVPTPDFLERTLGHFADPRVGFVQVMLTFSNYKESWVAQAAALTSSDFYSATSIGADGVGGATLIGSNALLRRTALASINGYQVGLAEDLATSVALHAAGWRSVYVPEPLAPGLAPVDLRSWFTQQFKWSRGVFEVLLMSYPRVFARLTWGQRLSYAVRMTYYWLGPVISMHLAITVAVLFGWNRHAVSDLQQYLMHSVPLVLSFLLIRAVAWHIWRHPATPTGLLWEPMILVYSTWPIYTITWVMALARVPLGFRLTPKRPLGPLNPFWLLPQMAALLLLTGGLLYTSTAEGAYRSYGLLCFAVFQGAPQMLFLWKSGACGYDFGLSCKPGLCTVNDSLLALPRLQVEGSDTLEMFATKLKPDAEGALLKNPSNSRSAAL